MLRVDPPGATQTGQAVIAFADALTR